MNEVLLLWLLLTDVDKKEKKENEKSNVFLVPCRAKATSAMTRILIKGGKVVNDDCTQEADVYIENGIVQQVGKELMIPGGAKVIDASGKLVLPGGIDTSVHLEESFMNATTADDFYSGTKVRSSRNGEKSARHGRHHKSLK